MYPVHLAEHLANSFSVLPGVPSIWITSLDYFFGKLLPIVFLYELLQCTALSRMSLQLEKKELALLHLCSSNFIFFFCLYLLFHYWYLFFCVSNCFKLSVDFQWFFHS